MKKIEIIKSYYEPNMGKGLPDYRVLGWESEQAQHKRFEILHRYVALQGKKLLDVGCGMANLYDYLIKKGVNFSYTGVDILESMIVSAKQKRPGAELICADIFKHNPFEENSFDVTYSSGIFNINMGNNKDFLIKAIELFLKLSREAVVFNLLHFKSPDKEEQYYYFNPDEIEDILEDKFSNLLDSVQIVEGYLQNDFTVILMK